MDLSAYLMGRSEAHPNPMGPEQQFGNPVPLNCSHLIAIGDGSQQRLFPAQNSVSSYASSYADSGAGSGGWGECPTFESLAWDQPLRAFMLRTGYDAQPGSLIAGSVIVGSVIADSVIAGSVIAGPVIASSVVAGAVIALHADVSTLRTFCLC
eukprot:gene28451-31596_t